MKKTAFCFCVGPGIIVELARANRFSATLTAKALLVDHLTETSGEGKPPTKQQVSALMRDTNLIEDSHVAVEVLKATLSDESYGYLSECTKRSIGAEYERRLKRHLRKLNISFQVIYNTGNDRFSGDPSSGNDRFIKVHVSFMGVKSSLQNKCSSP